MNQRFSRTEKLIGQSGAEKLARSAVAVFGVGGVGSFAAEGLARAGIGRLDLIDDDVIDITNINRQLHALGSTVGRSKALVMKERIADINPAAKVAAIQKFYLPENGGEFSLEQYDYIVDAIDTVAAKIDLAVRAANAGVPIISSMGAGNKLHPEQFVIADIYETRVCPLARVMRRELRARGVEKLKVVYSEELPLPPREAFNEQERRAPGSISFTPSAAGLIAAGEVVRDLLRE